VADDVQAWREALGAERAKPDPTVWFDSVTDEVWRDLPRSATGFVTCCANCPGQSSSRCCQHVPRVAAAAVPEPRRASWWRRLLRRNP